MILIVDFGSQTTHLISRRLKDLGVVSSIVVPEVAVEAVQKLAPLGIILSGGPASVYEKNAPSINPKIYSFDLPILGICYGFQITVKLLGGNVVAGKKEYGPSKIKIVRDGLEEITRGLPQSFTVWMSHGDEITKLPKDFEVYGITDTMPFAFAQNTRNKIYGVQFHPEVEHTQNGQQILENFVRICGAEKNHKEVEVKDIVEKIKKQVGKTYVIGAVSGGVDSSVAGALVAKAIGDKFIPIYVDNGLMRDKTAEHVKLIFKKHNVRPIIVNAQVEMMKRLKGVTNSEEKRKIIGNFYIELFEKELKKLKNKDIRFLMQGTIYSDVIESKGSKHASKIKSHHNVGGLPKNMKLKLLEPLRELYKDEVRALGRTLGLPSTIVNRQPFPGPGYAVRIREEVTQKRLNQEKQADEIILEELEIAGWLSKVFLSFPVMTGAYSTAVKGDGRFFGEVIALRIIESADIMTTTWSHLPYDLLQKISSRIVNEVPEISRVVFDITTKPPATMEWE